MVSTVSSVYAARRGLAVVVWLVACRGAPLEARPPATATDEPIVRATASDGRAQPSQLSAPANPAQPANPVQPANPANPAQPANPANPVQPVQPVQPANPSTIPIATPATLGVHDMVGHPARWNGQSVILFARLRHRVIPCKKAPSPSCRRPWLLIDTNDAKQLTVALDPNGLELPLVCHPRALAQPASSPCTPEALDPEQRYRLEGRLAYERGDTRFIATHIELAPPA